MNYCLENACLCVTVSDLGAELQSIVSKRSGTEYLWQGDARYWDERAPVLFPICGRLTGGIYTYEGKTYEMGLHGFVRDARFTVEEQGATSITLAFTPTEEHSARYPFSYRLRVRYELCDSTLRQSFLVDNLGEGELPFSIGAHPGFRVPSHEGESFSDSYIEFACGAQPQQVIIGSTGFPTGEVVPFSLTDGTLPLTHELFDGAGLFFSDMGDTVALKSRKNSSIVRLTYTDMTHLGFWKPDHTDAPFVCIEPWHGLPTLEGTTDDFATKPYMIHLAGGESYESRIDIAIEE